MKRNNWKTGALAVIFLVLAAMLAGCGSKSKSSGYLLPGGGCRLPISEDDWKVEKDDDGDLLFISKNNDMTAFSASKWENNSLPAESEYEIYFDQYLEGIRQDHPEAEKLVFDTPKVGGVTALYMGIRFQMDGAKYRVLMYLIPISEGQDLLSVTMTVPETGADAPENPEATEKEFRDIIEGIQPV